MWQLSRIQSEFGVDFDVTTEEYFLGEGYSSMNLFGSVAQTPAILTSGENTLAIDEE